MTDQKNNANQHPPRQNSDHPLDPTQNAQDLMGDTYGLTGITSDGDVTMTPQPSSPQDGITKEETTEKAYNHATLQGMSEARQESNEDTASEQEVQHLENNQLQTAQITSPPPGMDEDFSPAPDDIPFSALHTADKDEPNSPAVQGEQSVSGDMPDPDSDDDTLANTQAVGFQMDEDPEHPKELGFEDLDEAEEEIRET